MIERIIRIILSVFGVFLGIGNAVLMNNFGLLNFLEGRQILFAYIFLGIFFGLLFFILTPKLKHIIENIGENFGKEILKFQTNDIIFGSFGLIVALIIAFLLSQPIYNINIPIMPEVISLLIYAVLGYIGIIVSVKKKDDVIRAFNPKFTIGKKQNKVFLEYEKEECGQYKILDTSTIIDGRIADISKTGFIEGSYIVPTFVLEELQHIADSSDDMKRIRGRRGLDILNAMQKDKNVDMIIDNRDFKDINEVDSKLIRLAEIAGGKIITNDYNLNKVAKFKGVQVLIVNELADSLKPVVLPGEDMEVKVVKSGKEKSQGLAYLDDGTMIVIENGERHVGSDLKITVTSILQTAAGRMIFAKKR